MTLLTFFLVFMMLWLFVDVSKHLDNFRCNYVSSPWHLVTSVSKSVILSTHYLNIRFCHQLTLTILRRTSFQHREMALDKTVVNEMGKNLHRIMSENHGNNHTGGLQCHVMSSEISQRTLFISDIDQEILRSMKVVGTVGYARNVTNMKRNQVFWRNHDIHDENTQQNDTWQF